jgi:hypothetical protein
MQNLAQSPGVITRRGYHHLRPILMIGIDGPDASVAQRKYVSGLVLIHISLASMKDSPEKNALLQYRRG